MGWEKKAPGNELSHSLQVLGHGFVLATITKQQTTSVGKGHKKFSFPLLKPSGAYKKKPNWLVGMVGSTSSPLGSSWHFSRVWWHSEVPPWEQGGQRMLAPLRIPPAAKEVPQHPSRLNSPYLSQTFL